MSVLTDLGPGRKRLEMGMVRSLAIIVSGKDESKLRARQTLRPRTSISCHNRSPRLRPKLVSTSLVLLACLGLPACKRTPDTSTTVRSPPKTVQKSSAQAAATDTLVQQATSRCRQRIREAASEHAANAKRMNEAKVLDMKEVTQQGQLETKREVVRKFLTSNEALRSLLGSEEAVFAEELAKLNVPAARIKAAQGEYQSGIPGKAVTLRMRATNQRIGNSTLGALDFLNETWGEWNYNKEYEQVQFSPPGALRKYTEFMEAIEAASRERNELNRQSKTGENTGP